LKNCKDIYIKRKNKFESLLERQTKAANLLSNIRLLVFIFGTGISIFFGFSKLYLLLFAAIIISLVFFLYLVIKHDKLLNRKNYSTSLVEINKKSLDRVDNRWSDFPDDGSEFEDENHEYARDLDIFGRGSLFQWINATITYLGRKKIINMLTMRPENCNTVLLRQEAVRELASKLSWRQRLLAEGMLVKDKMKDPGFLIDWANEKQGFYCKNWVKAAIRLLPIITCSILFAGLILSSLPLYITAAVLLLFQYILIKIKSKEHRAIFQVAELYNDELKVYHKMLKVLCRQKYDSLYLAELGEKLFFDDIKKSRESISHSKARSKHQKRNGSGQNAYGEMERLARIVDSISNRHTPFYFIFNMIALWDYQNLIALERWKDSAGKHLINWFDVLGEFEALSSIAIIRYEHPEWATPIISEEGPGFKAVEMGHPLLSEKRVCNNLSIQLPTRAILVTGSNMSGKSTYLRTAGINLVLAYTGAPVCSKSFTAILSDIHTCMRVNDNLEKGISSFYSELIRIKTIVETANTGRKVFFLLDEIFKGTNSTDRHTGARVLIKKLCETNSFGLVSTHDLELCQLEQESPKIKNYHFQEHYDNGKILFDYKLRPGASTTRNAVFLMKMAGIDIQD
jgi:Mismatch repair ATPase (MutS family)